MVEAEKDSCFRGLAVEIWMLRVDHTAMMSTKCPCEQQLYLCRNLWKLEKRRREESQEEEEDTGRIVPLSDSPFRLISTHSSSSKPGRGGKKNK
ncbi:hypothetical protein CRENBAI_000730 [Crenichthys baileyi]|uniref:Uncharacterized protein n=1 Tax=Crenichthys baileyi TaxID=28760 RepID=A0AAV9RSY5_9TELE